MDSENIKVEEFEAVSAEAAETIPMTAGEIKKGDYAMLGDVEKKPCKIVNVSVSKTGKHGHAKANFSGNCIFSGKKVEDMCPSSHVMYVPVVRRLQYLLVDVDQDGTLSLMDEEDTSGDIINKYSLTKEGGGYDEVSTRLEAMFAEGKDVIVTIMTAVNQYKVVECKERPADKN